MCFSRKSSNTLRFQWTCVYQTLHDMTLTRNSGFAKYYMYAVDWNGFKNGKKGSDNIPTQLYASAMHSGRKLGRAVVSHIDIYDM